MTITELVTALAPQPPLDPDALARARARVFAQASPVATEPWHPRERWLRRRSAMTVSQRWWAAGIAVAATVGTVLAVPLLAASPATASWAAKPTALTPGETAAQAALCETDLPAGLSPESTLTERRGSAVLVLLASSSWTRLCINDAHANGMIAGTRVDQPAANPDQAVDLTVYVGTWSPELGAWAAAAGRVSPKVSRVTVSIPGQVEVMATVHDGYWAAWWPGEPEEGATITAYSASGILLGRTTDATD